MHFVSATLIDKILYLFLSKYLFCLYGKFSPENLTSRGQARKSCSDDKNQKDGEKNKEDSVDMLDDAFEQAGSHSAQEMDLDGSSK